MTEFATLWDEAGASYDAEQTVRRMASARSAAGFAPFLLAAKSPAEFDQRCVLASDRIQSTAAAHGVSPDDLLGQVRGEHSLLMEAQATRRTAAAKCPNCGGSGSVPAQGHEDADDVDNGHVQCPTCHGSGEKKTATKAPQRPAQQPVQPQRGFDLYASLHTALEEGQDPLAWIQAQDPGNPTPEKPSEHLDHGDYSNSYSEVPSAAGVVGADKAAQASKRDPRHPFGQPKTAGKEHYDKGYALGDRQVRSDLTSYSLPFGQHVDFVRGHRDAHDGLEPDYDRWQDTSSKTAVVETRVLHMIRDRDPDGGSKEPTADDYAAHKNWAVGKFGQDAWDAYKGGNWDEHHEASKTAGRRHPFG